MGEEFNWNEITPTLILNFILAITVVVMISFLIISIAEVLSAKSSCNKLNGTYTLKNFNHFCNNQSFYKYSDGEWGWDRNYTNQINLDGFD